MQDTAIPRVVQVGTKTPATQLRAVHGELQSRKLCCERVIRTSSKRNVTWLMWPVEHPHEDEEHVVEHPHADLDPWEVQRTNVAGSAAGLSRC